MVVTIDMNGNQVPLNQTHREPKVITPQELNDCYIFLRKLIGLPDIGQTIKTNELVGGDNWNWAENGFPIECLHEGYYNHFSKYIGKPNGYLNDDEADMAAIHQAGVSVGHLVKNILDDMQTADGSNVVFQKLHGYTATYKRIK